MIVVGHIPHRDDQLRTGYQSLLISKSLAHQVGVILQLRTADDLPSFGRDFGMLACDVDSKLRLALAGLLSSR